jgi:signal transduction histidine kinase
MNIIQNELNDILKEPWIPRPTARDGINNIVLQFFILLTLLMVIYWDFHQLNQSVTLSYLAVKGLIVSVYLISIVATYFKKAVNFWPILDMAMMLLYGFYGMIMIHFTYCFSFWEVYLIISIFFNFSRKVYIILMTAGIITNYYAILLAQEPNYVKEGMSFKPDMLAGTYIVFVLSFIIFFVVTKKKQALYEMQERFANIGRQSSFVFHEIKKPINRLINSSPIQDHDLKRINNIILNVELMLNNSEVFAHSFKHFEVENLYKEIKKNFSDFFELYNIHFECVNNSTGPIFANEDLMYQVLSNLTVNAIEAISLAKNYHQKSETIKIVTRDLGKKVEISFKNTGPTIPKDYENKIFHPFTSSKEKQSNSGLGLSFCKNIIEGHRGVIKLINHNDGPEFVIII